MKAKVTNLPDEDHVMRYVSWARLRRDEDDNVLGVLGEAFQLRPDEDSLSVNWLEYFEGDRDTKIHMSVKTFRATSWLVELEGKPTIEGLYYVLVRVGTDRNKDRFFVMSQLEARHLRDEHKLRRGGTGSLDSRGYQGFNYGDAFSFLGGWDRLPAKLATRCYRLLGVFTT